MLYFEELREVAGRRSGAAVYYITPDKIERPSGLRREREKEREGGGKKWKVFVVALLDSPLLATKWEQESTICRWLVNRVTTCVLQRREPVAEGAGGAQR